MYRYYVSLVTHKIQGQNLLLASWLTLWDWLSAKHLSPPPPKKKKKKKNLAHFAPHTKIVRKGYVWALKRIIALYVITSSEEPNIWLWKRAFGFELIWTTGFGFEHCWICPWLYYTITIGGLLQCITFWAHLYSCTMGSKASPSVCLSILLCKLLGKTTRKREQLHPWSLGCPRLVMRAHADRQTDRRYQVPLFHCFAKAIQSIKISPKFLQLRSKSWKGFTTNVK